MSSLSSKPQQVIAAIGAALALQVSASGQDTSNQVNLAGYSFSNSNNLQRAHFRASEPLNKESAFHGTNANFQVEQQRLAELQRQMKFTMAPVMISLERDRIAHLKGPYRGDVDAALDKMEMAGRQHDESGLTAGSQQYERSLKVLNNARIGLMTLSTSVPIAAIGLLGFLQPRRFINAVSKVLEGREGFNFHQQDFLTEYFQGARSTRFACLRGLDVLSYLATQRFCHEARKTLNNYKLFAAGTTLATAASAVGIGLLSGHPELTNVSYGLVAGLLTVATLSPLRKNFVRLRAQYLSKEYELWSQKRDALTP